MPPISVQPWPTSKVKLYEIGLWRINLFCRANGIECPAVTVIPREAWLFGGTCAFYRPDDKSSAYLFEKHEGRLYKRGYRPGINICLEECQTPCGTVESRNWTWPGSVTDREPYGVLAHELGHHCDWLVGKNRWSFGSEYSTNVKDKSKEPPITSYAPDPGEWFAEIFRVFVTNHGLLKALRPKAYGILLERWKPVGTSDWLKALGPNVPDRVVRTLRNKGAK